MATVTSVLNTINTPQNVKKLNPQELNLLAEEIRETLIKRVGAKGENSPNKHACNLNKPQEQRWLHPRVPYRILHPRNRLRRNRKISFYF